MKNHYATHTIQDGEFYLVHKALEHTRTLFIQDKHFSDDDGDHTELIVHFQGKRKCPNASI